VWGAPPITYVLDGRQYVVIPSGVTVIAFGLPSTTAPASVTAKQ
jgi:hypothetical protein